MRFRSLIFFNLLFAASVFSQPGLSGLDSIVTEEITVTANKIRTTLLQSPNKVQLLDAAVLSGMNGNRLSDALNLGDAVFIKDYGFNSGLKSISLNSTQSEHTLILLDGVKLNSGQNSLFDLGLLQMDDVSRVEISNGGSSSLYGSEAVGGVINIITGMNDEGRIGGAELMTELGSYELRKIRLKAVKNFDLNKGSVLGVRISFTDERARNDYLYMFNNGFGKVKKGRDNSAYINRFVNLSLNYLIGNTASLKLYTFYNYWDREVPGPELGYPASSAKQIDKDLMSALSFEKSFGTRAGLRTFVNFRNSLMKYFDPATFTLPEQVNSFYRVNDLTNSSEVMYKPNIGQEVKFGYDLSYSTIRSNETENGSQLKLGFFSASKAETDGLLFSRITAFPSVRYDYYSVTGSGIITGKLGLNLKPFMNQEMSIKASLGNNFRAPSFNDLYWTALGNKDLLPERSVSFDLGAYYRFKLLSDNQAEVSYFRTDTKDRIVWSPDNSGIWRPSNLGRVRSEGLDLSLGSGVDLGRGFRTGLKINYNLASSTKKSQDFPGDPAYNKQLIYLPQEYAKASIFISFSSGGKTVKTISMNLFYNFTGTRYSDPENTLPVPYYELIDGNINVTLTALGLESFLKFSVNNITNTDYQVVSGYPMPLRNYRFYFSIKY